MVDHPSSPTALRPGLQLVDPRATIRQRATLNEVTAIGGF